MKMTGGRGKMFLSPLSRVRFLTKVPRVGEQTDKYGDWIRESVITYIIYAFTLYRSNNEFDSIITYLIYALWSARESVEMTRRDHKSDNDV